MLLNEKEEQFDDPLTVQINKYADRCINNSCIEIQARVFLPV